MSNMNFQMLYLGKRIKQAREQAGFTQEKLAELIGTSRAAIARYELGEIEPKLRNLIAIAQCLSVTTDWLLGNVEKNNPTEGLSPAAMEYLQAFVKEIRIGEKK